MSNRHGHQHLSLLMRKHKGHQYTRQVLFPNLSSNMERARTACRKGFMARLSPMYVRGYLREQWQSGALGVPTIVADSPRVSVLSHCTVLTPSTGAGIQVKAHPGQEAGMGQRRTPVLSLPHNPRPSARCASTAYVGATSCASGHDQALPLTSRVPPSNLLPRPGHRLLVAPHGGTRSRSGGQAGRGARTSRL